MRAEITRLRANVMTAHEKIRTLEQIHAQDEERISLLQEELGIKKPESAAAAGDKNKAEDAPEDEPSPKKPRATVDETVAV